MLLLIGLLIGFYAGVGLSVGMILLAHHRHDKR